jgi:hypothetical protein
MTMATTTTAAVHGAGGRRLEIWVYFRLKHNWGIQGGMSTRGGSHMTSKSRRCGPCYATSSMGALLPGTSFLRSREGGSLRSRSGEVFDHLPFSRCVNQVHALSLHLSYTLGGYNATELSISSWTAVQGDARRLPPACGARAVWRGV